jgi:hypothetical protein
MAGDRRSVTLAVVVVSYNVRDLLRVCLAGTYASLDRSPELDATVWVVDNASADGSAGMVAADFPQARLIPSSENLGFPGGNNLVLRRLGALTFHLKSYCCSTPMPSLWTMRSGRWRGSCGNIPGWEPLERSCLIPMAAFNTGHSGSRDSGSSGSIYSPLILAGCWILGSTGDTRAPCTRPVAPLPLTLHWAQR